jgi:ribosomal protein L29
MKKEELNGKLALLQENIRVIRFKAEGSKSKNVKELSTLKKQIARILTEINSKK